MDWSNLAKLAVVAFISGLIGSLTYVFLERTFG